MARHEKQKITCADCEYHQCNATSESGCTSCAGRCTILQKVKKCYIEVNNCEHFSQLQLAWKGTYL